MKKNSIFQAFVFLWITWYCTQMASAQVQIVIGNQDQQLGGAENSPTPYSNFWESRRVQLLYTASEIKAAGGGAGTINSLAWDVTIPVAVDLRNYQIRMAQVTETNLSVHNNATLTTVRTASNLSPGTFGWLEIPFTTPFVWNGTDNLLIDICWGANVSVSTTGTIWMYNSAPTQRRGITGNTVLCAINTNETANLKPRIRLTIDLPNCNGLPNGGSTSASPNTNYPQTLFVENSSTETNDGFTFLWQFSTDGGNNWSSAIGTNTQATYTPSVFTTTAFYRRQITCTATNESAFSTPIEVVVPYATLPYIQTFDNAWINGQSIRDLPDIFWKNTPNQGNNSWRRQDDGISANWNEPTNFTVIPFAGAGAANFHSYRALLNEIGSLDLRVNLNTPNPKLLRFQYQNNAGNDRLEVLESADGGLTFNLLTTLTATGIGVWQSQQLLLNSTNPESVIRFRAVSDNGASDIGIDELTIEESNVCVGIPKGGVAVANPLTNCSAPTTTISILNGAVGNGLSYQWQSSLDNINWTNITGETNETFTTPSSLTVSTWFRRVTTCTFNNESAISSSVRFDIDVVIIPANLPFLEDFENSWINGCANQDIPSNAWRNTPTTGFNSWRRQNEGQTAGWSVPLTQTVTPVSGSGAANFHSWESLPGLTGTLDLFINANVAGIKQLSFLYTNPNFPSLGLGNTDVLEIYESNDGLNFSLLTTLGVQDGWANISLPLSVNSPNSVIRFLAISDFGDTDLGIDDVEVRILQPCTGTPTAGNTVSPISNTCTIATATLYVENSATDTQTGFVFLWESSIDNGASWQSANGINDQETYIAIPSVTTLYRRAITCLASASTAFSTPVMISVLNPISANLPYLQNFESSWINGCSSDDLPDNSWKNTPFVGNASWRRTNEEASANWQFLTDPFWKRLSAVSGVGAATYHSYTTGTAEGTLDLYVDATPIGTKRLTFLYSNSTNLLSGTPEFLQNNNDQLEVLISTDGGVSFTSLLLLGSTGANEWEEKSVDFNANVNPTIIRFRGTDLNDIGGTDIGIDDVNVFVPNLCSGTPIGGTINSSVNNLCEANLAELTVSGASDFKQTGFTFLWEEFDNVNNVWIPANGANDLPIYEASPSNTTQYRRRITCTNGGESANSTTITLFVPVISYASLPYLENFENTWKDLCATQDIPNPTDGLTYWKNAPATGNNAWRRQDAGNTAGWTDANLGIINPFKGTGAANFHSWFAPNGQSGSLDLYVNLNVPNPHLKFYYLDREGDDFLEVELSEDGGNSFISLEILPNVTKWTEKTIPLPTNSTTAIIRFKATQVFLFNEQTDIGLDEVQVLSLPATDVAVTQIHLEQCSAFSAKVRITVSNLGTQAVSNIPVSFTFNGITYSATIPNTLTPLNGTFQFTFENSISISGLTNLNISASTNLGSDQNPTNDNFTQNLYVGNALTLPYSENFNNGLPTTWRTTQDITSNGWQFSSPNPPATGSGVAFPKQPSFFNYSINSGNADGSDFMAVDDDAGGFGHNASQDYLIMPTFNLIGYTNTSLSFDALMDNGKILFGADSSRLSVEVSLDGGNTWSIVQQIPDGVWKNYVVNLSAFDGNPNVTIGFHFDDRNLFAFGGAIDNVVLSATAGTLPQANITAIAVPDQAVSAGTKNHIIYHTSISTSNHPVSLTDIIFQPGGTYDVDDITPFSFKLWFSDDELLNAGDVLVAQRAVVPTGGTLLFDCLGLQIPVGTTRYLFLTVDIANQPEATLGNTIFIATPSLANNFFIQNGTKTGNLLAGGVQTIAEQNSIPTSANKEITIFQDESYAFQLNDFAFNDQNTQDILTEIQIQTAFLPIGSTFTLNNQPIFINQIIPANQIPLIQFTPALGATGANYAFFTFKVSDGRDFSAVSYITRFNVVGQIIFIPELFSPNGDNNGNDVFRILGAINQIANLRLRILDRNNQIVFETSDINQATQIGWDGTKNGVEQPAGSYIWYIDGTFTNGKPLKFNNKNTGVIRLIR